jgi:23S rRNA pseudouridine1911/1915/1917 synthase
MTEIETITFEIQESGERLDKAIANQMPELSRAAIQKLIKEGEVRVNGYTSKPSYRVEASDRIVLRVPPDTPPKIEPEAVPLDIIYEDAYLAAINKPAGMVVHPAYGHRSGTLVNALLHHYPETVDVGGLERAGIVHRLDKDTSGLLLIARDPDTHAALQRQFKRRHVHKVYIALVEDHPSPREGIIDAPIGRDKRNRKRMAIVRSGRRARTAYRVVQTFREYSLVEVEPETGRTHQIRVHMAWLGCPVVGDRVYGYRRQQLLRERHFLHAQRLDFTHPVTEERISLTAPLPQELEDVLRRVHR